MIAESENQSKEKDAELSKMKARIAQLKVQNQKLEKANDEKKPVSKAVKVSVNLNQCP